MVPYRFKLTTKDIICFLLFFSIVKIHAVPRVVQQVLKITSVVMIFGFLFCNYFKRLWNMGTCLGIVLLIPSVIGFTVGKLDLKTSLDGVLNSVILYLLYTFVMYMHDCKQTKRMLNNLYVLNLFACFISLISILCQGRSLYSAGTSYEYFFGNKFATLYLFMLLIGLAYTRYFNERMGRLERKQVLLCLIILEIFLSYWVRCSTTLIGGTIMFIAIAFSGKKMNWIRKLISTPIFSIMYFIIPGFLAVNIVPIIQIPSIRQFITGTLGKSEGLTGRVHIYSMLMGIFRYSPIIGNGYNSGIVNKLTEVGNAQNGLYQLLIEFGILGVGCITVLIYLSFKESRGTSGLWGIKVFVFAMCICAIVEISYNYLFFLGLFLLKFGICDERANLCLESYAKHY